MARKVPQFSCLMGKLTFMLSDNIMQRNDGFFQCCQHQVKKILRESSVNVISLFVTCVKRDFREWQLSWSSVILCENLINFSEIFCETEWITGTECEEEITTWHYSETWYSEKPKKILRVNFQWNWIHWTINNFIYPFELSSFTWVFLVSPCPFWVI